MVNVSGTVYAYIKATPNVSARLYPLLEGKDGRKFALIDDTQIIYLDDFGPEDRAANPDLFPSTAIVPVNSVPRVTAVTDGGKITSQKVTFPDGDQRQMVVATGSKIPSTWKECQASETAAKTCKQILRATFPDMLPHQCPRCDTCASCKKGGHREIHILSQAALDPDTGLIIGGLTPRGVKVVLEVPIDYPSEGLNPAALLSDEVGETFQTYRRQTLASNTPIDGRTSQGVWYLGKDYNEKILQQLKQIDWTHRPCAPQYVYQADIDACLSVEDMKSEEIIAKDTEAFAKLPHLIMIKRPIGALTKDPFHDSMVIGAANQTGDYYAFQYGIPVDSSSVPKSLLFTFPDASDYMEYLAAYRDEREWAMFGDTRATIRYLDGDEVRTLLVNLQEMEGELLKGAPGCKATELYVEGHCRRIRDLERRHIIAAKKNQVLPQQVVTLYVVNDSKQRPVIRGYWNEKSQFVVPKEPILITDEAAWLSDMAVRTNDQKTLEYVVEAASRQPAGTQGSYSNGQTTMRRVVTASRTSAERELAALR